MNAKTQPTPDPNRVTGPAGTRLVLPATGGFWRIQRDTGPDDSDPLEETREEALAWAKEIVGARGMQMHARPPRPSPNENADALAKAQPVVLSRRPLASGHPVLGKYEYAAEDRPLPARRSR